MQVVKIFNLGLNFRSSLQFLFFFLLLILQSGYWRPDNKLEPIELGTEEHISFEWVEGVVTQVGHDGILLHAIDMRPALLAVVAL